MVGDVPLEILKRCRLILYGVKDSARRKDRLVEGYLNSRLLRGREKGEGCKGWAMVGVGGRVVWYKEPVIADDADGRRIHTRSRRCRSINY